MVAGVAGSSVVVDAVAVQDSMAYCILVAGGRGWPVGDRVLMPQWPGHINVECVLGEKMGIDKAHCFLGRECWWKDGGVGEKDELLGRRVHLRKWCHLWFL